MRCGKYQAWLPDITLYNFYSKVNFKDKDYRMDPNTKAHSKENI